jgi:hypothetical protein
LMTNQGTGNKYIISHGLIALSRDQDLISRSGECNFLGSTGRSIYMILLSSFLNTVKYIVILENNVQISTADYGHSGNYVYNSSQQHNIYCVHVLKFNMLHGITRRTCYESNS